MISSGAKEYCWVGRPRPEGCCDSAVGCAGRTLVSVEKVRDYRSIDGHNLIARKPGTYRLAGLSQVDE